MEWAMNGMADRIRYPRGHLGLHSMTGADQDTGNGSIDQESLQVRDFLPLFIIVGIGFVTGILFMVEKLREKYTEKDIENLDAPPRYADLEPRTDSFDLNQEVPAPDEPANPPTYDTATRNQHPPSYEFVNHAFEEDPPAYEEPEIQTNQTYINQHV